MSLFHEIHDLNRRLFGAYFEVFLRVDVETLKRRDSRGLYSRAAEGHETNVAGVDLAAEFPLEPHLVLCNDKHRESLSALASRVVRAVVRPQHQVNLLSTTGARIKSNTGLPAKGRPKKRG